MQNRLQKGLLILAGIGLIACCGYVSIMQVTLCQTATLDEFTASPSISTFVDADDYTITDLMNISEEKVQEQLSSLDEAESDFVSAFYTCQNSDCTLFKANLRVHVQRRMTCYFAGTASDPFGSSVINFSFNTLNDDLSTVTNLRDDGRRNTLLWEELPLSIDEIVAIALEAVDAQYLNDNPEFELRVTLLRDEWTLTFRADATTVPDIRLQVDSNGNLLE